MAHHVYSTEALVLRASPTRESDLYLSLFARDIGFIRAMARSGREERSKMRYHLQDYSHSQISLVRGKELWRVTSANLLHNFYDIAIERQKLEVIVRVTSLLKRLLQGEGSNVPLFESCTRGFLYLIQDAKESETIRNTEYVIVLRILAHLGYIGSHKTLDVIAGSDRIDTDILDLVGEFRTDVADHINRAIAESQL
jgi:DNA repair protein RecO (recombination protein O)